MRQTKQQIAQKTGPDYRMMIVAALCLLLLGAGAAFAQTADEDVPVIYVDENGQPVDALDTVDAAPVHFYTAEELSTLVAPVALYPDDLLAIVLPASTYPLQIVQAARFLDQLEDDSSLKPDESWDESVVALLNYPEAVRLLNDDLDWTYELGDAFLAQQADVIAAVAEFRNLAYDAGNLKTDDYQVIDRSGTTIRIQPADPEVIYVPYYEPREVIVYQPYPVYRYYPRRYPVYYYPYPAGYAFRSGFFFGLTTAYVIGWNNYYINAYYYDYPRHPYYGHSYYNNYRYYHPPRRYYGHGYNGRYRWQPGPRYGGRPGHRPDRNGRGGRYVGGGRGGRNATEPNGRDGRGVRGDDGGARIAGDGRGRGGNRGGGRGGNGDRGGDRGGNNVTPGGTEPGSQINLPRQRPRVVRDNASGDREGNHRRMVEPEVVSVRGTERRNQNVRRPGNSFSSEDRLDRTNRNRQARSNRNQTRATEPEVVSVRNANRNNAQRRNRTDMASVRSALSESRNNQANRARNNNQQRQTEPVRSARSNPNRGSTNRTNMTQRRAQPARSNQARQTTQRPQVQPRQNQSRQNHVRQAEPRAQQRRQPQVRQASQRQSQPRQQQAPQRQSQPRQQSAPQRQGRQQAPQREAKQPRQNQQSERPQRTEQRNSSRNNRGGSRRDRK